MSLLIAVGIGVYLHHEGGSTPKTTNEAGPAIYSASPQQAKRTLGVLDELPGDAPAVGYIDVEALRKIQASPLAALLGLTGSNSAKDRDYQQFVRETGFDYARDLDQGAIAFWPDGVGEKAQGGPGNRAFVVADGRFDEGKIRAYALKFGRAHANGTQKIYEIPGKPTVSFEFLSPTRIAITSGSKPSDPMIPSHPAERDPAFQARIGRVAGAPLFAVVRTDKLPESFYSSFHNSPQIESLAKSVRSLTLAAQPQGNVLKVALDGESSSTKNALAITTLLEISRMGASMALSNPKTSAQLTAEQTTFLEALIRTSSISHRDRWVRVALDVTPQMLGAGKPASLPENTDRGNVPK